MAKLYQAAAGIYKLEELAQGDSLFHHLHPMTKLITVFIYLAAVLSLDSFKPGVLTPFILFPVVIISLSGIPYRVLFKRLLFALPFSFVGGISNLFLLREISFYIGNIAITEGMLSFYSIMFKTLFCVSAVLILVSTTPFNDIIRQMARLKVPEIICLQFIMTYRYITAVIDEAAAMYTAYLLRSGGMKGIRMKDMGAFLGRLILRGFDRAEVIYQAMKSRGFTGSFKGGLNRRFSLIDFIYTFSFIVLIIIFRFINIGLILENILYTVMGL